MSGDDVWRRFCGDEYGPRLRLLLALLAEVPAEVVEQALRDVDQAVAFGPLWNPSLWLDGQIFRNADEYSDFFRELLPVLRRLNALRQNSKGNPV